MPRCGYQGDAEECQDRPNDESDAWILIFVLVMVTILLVVGGIVTGVVIYKFKNQIRFKTDIYSFYDVKIVCFRKARFEASLMRRSWEISWADVIMDQGNMRLGQASRISLTSQSTAFRTHIVRIQNATYM